MKIQNLIEGRIFVAENPKEVDLMQRFSAALANYDMDKTPKVQRTKLQAMWLRVEYASGSRLEMSMGVKRTDVFACNEDD